MGVGLWPIIWVEEKVFAADAKGEKGIWCT